MKFGFRIPSLKKRIAARTSLKRFVRHSMGLKAPRGFGVITNPKRALYNRIYTRTTFGFKNIKSSGDKKHVFKQVVADTPEATPSSSPILDKHFELSQNIPFLYSKREADGVEKTIEACKQQIDLAPYAKSEFLKQYPGEPLPGHNGYEKLAIILEKQGKYQEAKNLCLQAKEEGWNGEWNKRMERCQKNI